jgi:predicted methyltransferase MtxX (methanogen marker protein 4)
MGRKKQDFGRKKEVERKVDGNNEVSHLTIKNNSKIFHRL